MNAPNENPQQAANLLGAGGFTGNTPPPNISTATGDTEAALGFLKSYGKGWHANWFVQIVAIKPAQTKGEKSEIEARTVPPADIDSLKPFIDKHQGVWNLYFCVNPLHRQIYRKAKKTDIIVVVYLHSDNDPAKDKPLAEERKRLRDDIDEFPLKPTYLIDSGNGFGIFFRLETPSFVVSHNLAELEVWNKRLAKYFGGDSCHDICRLMRLPGTINLPDYRKIEKGRVQVPARLLDQNEATYRLEDFGFLAEPAAPTPPAAPAVIDLPAVNKAALAARLQVVQIDPELAKLLNGEALPWMDDVTKSGFDFAFAFRLAVLGFPDNEIAALLRQYPYGKIYERKDEDAEKDIARILGKVRAKLGEASGADIPVSPAIHLCTDLANAKRLKQAAGGNIIFSAGRYLIWTGSYWEADEDAVYRQAFGLSALIKAEAEEWESKATSSEDEGEHNRAIAKALRKWGEKSENRQYIENAVYLLRRKVGVPADTLDSNPYSLNVLNGTIDLHTGQLREHNKADRITKLIPIAYHPEAQAPLFGKALADITGEAGFEHKPIAKALQRWFGYCSTGLTTEQVFVVHWGSGANGKSLLLGTVERVLGPYAGAAAPGLLMGGVNNRHPTELADLRGKRVMTAYESSESGRLNEEFIKQATGSDRIKARFMRQDFFEFDPTHKLQLVTNHKPQIVGQDHAIWRRVLLFPYNIRFGTQAEMDKGEAHHVKNTVLTEALKDEDEGILAWIVKGAVMWRMVGLQPPDTVLAAGVAYRKEQDRVGQFIDECCERQEGAKVSLKQLYLMYVQWTKNNGYIPIGRNKFADLIEGRPGVSAREQENFKYLGYACKGKVFTGMKYTGLGL